MLHISELLLRGLLASKNEAFFDSPPFRVRRALRFDTARATIRNPPMTRVRLALLRLQMIETYFL